MKKFHVGLLIGTDLIATIDQLAAENERTRSGQIRYMLTAHLANLKAVENAKQGPQRGTRTPQPTQWR